MDSRFFLSIFLAYIACLIGLGWLASRRQCSGDDFLLAGRGLPVFLTIGTTVATMVGTGSSMGAVGFGYANGWTGTLYGVGGAVGILLLAFCFASVRRLNFATMSEEISYYVGANPLVRRLVAVLIFIACIGWLGAHILGGSLYLAWIAEIDLFAAKLIIALGFAIFVVVGGYRAVVWTDTLQAIVLFVGFVLMAVLAVQQVGGWESLLAAQSGPGTSTASENTGGILHGVSLVVVIAVGVLATPSFRQRIYSARSEQTVRRSFLASGILYLFFCAVPAIIGMAAFALNPELDNRNFAFPYLAMEVLPLGAGMVVLIAGLSATMSSASSDAVAGVTVLVRDLSFVFRSRAMDPQREIFYSRAGLVAVIGIALLLVALSDDLIGYITAMISTVMTGLCVCGLLGRFWTRFNWQGAVAALSAGAVVSQLVIWTAQDFWGNPALPSLAAALVAAVGVSLATPSETIDAREALQILQRERRGRLAPLSGQQ
ncbi:sodium:solute symporter family protein [Microbulbifer halophilus]|uniref:Sodium:solute symporter family protein n=1 Tax=Microbulbifer halophilus TaxID=453963 RepID=A0ABW5EF90_9GAMM|nr:sodium:solute symporter family protein [Microbulbifer halophilus]MCW8125736.1 sodium:solute symporter family protein [Microbulbifer halophilus]